MTDSLNTFFIEQGILGVIVLLLLGAVVYLFRQLQAGQKVSLEEKGEVVRALVESANSNVQVAQAIDKTNELLRSLVTRQGGG